MMKNVDYIQEVKEDGQLQEIPITPPPPEPHNAASSKACPRTPRLMTTRPNVPSKRPRTEVDAHRLRVYMDNLMTTSIHTLTIMGSSCREMGETCRAVSLTQLREVDKYDKARTELQKKLAESMQDPGIDEDVC